MRTGVATQIKALNCKCLYTHCYGHALNLVVGNAVKSVKGIKDAVETVREVEKLVRKSPQRNTQRNVQLDGQFVGKRWQLC